MRYIPSDHPNGPSLAWGSGKFRPAILGPNYRHEGEVAPASPPVSYAPEVVADSTGRFFGNSLRFATREEADKNVRNLAARWFLVTEYRVVESSDPVNVRWDEIKGVVFLEGLT